MTPYELLRFAHLATGYPTHTAAPSKSCWQGPESTQSRPGTFLLGGQLWKTELTF